MPRTSTINVTTTHNIDGWTVEEYLGPVVAHTVTGTGVLFDLLAKLVDFTGGRFGRYQQQMHTLSREAVQSVCAKARSLGGNWVIGLTVDMDEVSGQGKQMFMVTAMGTVVRARPVATVQERGHPRQDGQISAEDLHTALRRFRVLDDIESSKPIFTDELWSVLNEQRLSEALPRVVAELTRLSPLKDATASAFRTRTTQFVEQLDPVEAENVLHDLVAGDDELSGRVAAEIIVESHLLGLAMVRSLLETRDGDRRCRLLQLVRGEQRNYTTEDVSHLRAIAAFCTEANFPRIDTPLYGRDGKPTVPQKVRCRCGMERPAVAERCYQRTCRRDSHGFQPDDITFEKAREHCLEFAALLERALSEGRTANPGI